MSIKTFSNLQFCHFISMKLQENNLVYCNMYFRPSFFHPKIRI